MKSTAHLDEALARNARAYVTLLAFARQAEIDGHKPAACLFRAAAQSRKVRADICLEALAVVRSPAENLAAVIAGEVHEADELYPVLIETARKEQQADIRHAFLRARSAMMKNIGLYETARAEWEEGASAEFCLCMVCGYLYQGHEPEDCPVCGEGPEAAERI
ncbi:rubrerythrin family protein [Geobacter sp. SVR]|uniref:rubrerythrin family protein n=1 Tax=Geobacter sp. SVR TaxID=2495594 RepID=UPI00143F0266|nr:rubrerythrin family protein [Geobacter sp. SVR]BCS55069.1 rubrerythrin [Geobacter sp. SVR]GCF85251.1 rubrerythrin [Geobacter sp. SVR]